MASVIFQLAKKTQIGKKESSVYDNDDGRSFKSEDHRGECPFWVWQTQADPRPAWFGAIYNLI